MAINSVAEVVTYNCDGATVRFPITFTYLLDEYVLVKHYSASTTLLTDLEIPTHYTIADDEVETVSTYPIGDKIYLLLNVEITQETDLEPNGKIASDLLDFIHDKLTLISQQLNIGLNGTLRLEIPENDAVLTLPGATERANKFLTFNGDGDAIVITSVDTLVTPVSSYGATLIYEVDDVAARDHLDVYSKAEVDSDLDTLNSDLDTLKLEAVRTTLKYGTTTISIRPSDDYTTIDCQHAYYGAVSYLNGDPRLIYVQRLVSGSVYQLARLENYQAHLYRDNNSDVRYTLSAFPKSWIFYNATGDVTDVSDYFIKDGTSIIYTTDNGNNWTADTSTGLTTGTIRPSWCAGRFISDLSGNTGETWASTNGRDWALFRASPGYTVYGSFVDKDRYFRCWENGSTPPTIHSEYYSIATGWVTLGNIVTSYENGITRPRVILWDGDILMFTESDVMNTSDGFSSVYRLEGTSWVYYRQAASAHQLFFNYVNYISNGKYVYLDDTVNANYAYLTDDLFLTKGISHLANGSLATFSGLASRYDFSSITFEANNGYRKQIYGGHNAQQMLGVDLQG